MPIGLLLAHQLDPAVRPRLTLAAERAGVTLRTWESGSNLRTGEPAPTFIVAPLAGGVRRLPTEVVHLADDVYPAACVLLLCRDQLVRPHVDLGDGRLVLIDPGASADDLAERFRAAGRWRDGTAQASSGPLREVRADGARAVAMRVGEPGGSLVCVPGASGVIALLGADPARDAPPPGLDGALTAWASQPEQASARTTLATLLAPWTALAALGGGRWVLAGESCAQLLSPLRLPSWWSPASDDQPRLLDSEGGDVALIASALPDDEDCAPQRLVAVARDGGRALAEHLARRAQATGTALLGAVIDGGGP